MWEGQLCRWSCERTEGSSRRVLLLPSHGANRIKTQPQQELLSGWISKCVEQLLVGLKHWVLSLWFAHIHFLAGRLEANRQLIRKITEELNIMEEVGSSSQTDKHGSQSFTEIRGQAKPTCLSLKGQPSRASLDQEGNRISKGLLWNTRSSGPRDSNQDLETCVATTYVHNAWRPVGPSILLFVLFFFFLVMSTKLSLWLAKRS